MYFTCVYNQPSTSLTYNPSLPQLFSTTPLYLHQLPSTYPLPLLGLNLNSSTFSPSTTLATSSPFPVTPPLNNSLTTLPLTTVSSTTPSTFPGPTLPYQIPLPAHAPPHPGGKYTMTFPAYLCPPM